MNNHNLDARRATRLVLAQLAAMLLAAVVTAFFGWDAARDALIGGLAAVLGSALFAVWVFGPYQASQPGRIVARFYGGELIKIMTIVVVFAAAMKGLSDLKPLPMFGAFLFVQVFPPLLANKIAR